MQQLTSEQSSLYITLAGIALFQNQILEPTIPARTARHLNMTYGWKKYFNIDRKRAHTVIQQIN